MTARSMWYGYEIEFVGSEFVFSDTGKRTAGSDRPCGHCQKHKTAEGHDACLGTLPGVRNACCGHGQIAEAYVQMPGGKLVQGQKAVELIAKMRVAG